MTNRIIAIGDIHGCLLALRALIGELQLGLTDTVVTLGDYVSRGPDGRGVIDELIRLSDSCNLVPLLGNHEQLLLHNRSSRTQIPGHSSIDQDTGLELFCDRHFEFLESCVMHYEIDTHFFVHANYEAHKELSEQDHYTLLWPSLNAKMPKRHCSRKTAVVGHTSQRTGEILDRKHLKCIDTYCYGGGWLTAMDVHTEQLWQVDKNGMHRGTAK